MPPQASLPEPVALRQALSAEELRSLRTGTPAQRLAALEALPADKQDEVIAALPARHAPGAVCDVSAGSAPQHRTDRRARRRWWRATSPKPRSCAPSTATASWKKCSPISGSTTSTSIWTRAPTTTWSPNTSATSSARTCSGKFRDLLEATAKSPAMLFYLDNWQSVGAAAAQRPAPAPRPQRKLRPRAAGTAHPRRGRRLHAEGRHRSGALLHRLDHRPAAARRRFRLSQRRRHDNGEKIVLGVTIPAGGGMKDGEKVLDILAHHPATAHFISREAGAALRGRRSAARAGGPHGADVPQDRWRPARGDGDHARFEGILVRGRLPLEDEIAARDGGRARCAPSTATWISPPPWSTRWRSSASRSTARSSPPATPTRAREWMNYGRPAGAHEFRRAAGRQQGAGRESRGGGRGQLGSPEFQKK